MKTSVLTQLWETIHFPSISLFVEMEDRTKSLCVKSSEYVEYPYPSTSTSVASNYSYVVSERVGVQCSLKIFKYD
jgi:hypothetical protein